MLDRLNRIFILLGAVALFAVIAVTLYDILIALITGRPFSGVYDVVQAVFAASVFFALPEVFRDERNIQVNLIDAKLSAGALKALVFVARVATVVFICIIAWSELKPAWDAWIFEDKLYETGLPVWVIWVPILLGSFMAIVMAISTFWKPAVAPDLPALED